MISAFQLGLEDRLKQISYPLDSIAVPIQKQPLPPELRGAQNT